jgi:WD40 repeat protein
VTPGTDPDPITPGEPSPIERCIAEGGHITPAWDANNLHGAVVSIGAHGDVIVLGSVDGSVKQWSTHGEASPVYGLRYADSGPVVNHMTFTSDGSLLAASADGSIQEWDTESTEPVRTMPVSDQSTGLRVTAASPDALHAAAAIGGVTEKSIFAIDRATNTISAPLETSLWGVFALAYDADHLYAAGHYYNLGAIDRFALDGSNRESWDGDNAMNGHHIKALAVTTDRAIAAADGVIAIFDTANLAAGPIVRVDAPDHRPTGVLLLPGGMLFATTGAEGTLQLWKFPSAEHVATVAIPSAIGIVADAKTEQLFTSGDDGSLHAFRCGK